MTIKIILIFIAGILDVLIGLFVLVKNPREQKNVSFFLFSISIALWSLTVAIFLITDSRYISFICEYIFSMSLVTISATFYHLSLVFSDKDDGSTRNKYILMYSLIPLAMIGVFVPGLYIKDFIIHDWGKESILGTGYYFLSLVYAVIVLISFIRLYKGINNSKLTANERKLNKIIFYSLLFGFIIGSICNWFLLLFHNYKYIWVGPYTLFIFVATMSYAITKHRLMDISVIISRTVAELATIVSFGSIYIGIAWLFRLFISTDVSIAFLLATIAYGIIIGLIHERVRLMFQTTSDKVILKGKYDYYKELSEISSKITRNNSKDDVLFTLNRIFNDVIQVYNPKIYLPDEYDKQEIRDIIPITTYTFKNDNLFIPCIMEDRPIAMFVLGRKKSDEQYTDEDVRLLLALADQTALALDHFRMYEEALRAQKQLLMADKLSSLGRIAASLAHEIKNPLAAIKGLSQMIDKNINDREFMMDFKEVVPREIDRIDSLVGGMTKLGRETKPLHIKVNIDSLIDNVLKLFNSKIKGQNIELTKNLSSKIEINGDPEQLTQVFTNLLLNAIQAMPNGGKLEIKTSQFDQKVLIEIRDNGPGIPEDKLKDIFEPFFTTKEEGMGLGLAITYKIIKEHGGEIEVENNKDSGTKFRITLPLIK